MKTPNVLSMKHVVANFIEKMYFLSNSSHAKDTAEINPKINFSSISSERENEKCSHTSLRLVICVAREGRRNEYVWSCVLWFVWRAGEKAREIFEMVTCKAAIRHLCGDRRLEKWIHVKLHLVICVAREEDMVAYEAATCALCSLSHLSDLWAVSWRWFAPSALKDHHVQ